jgi:hypothetical protein
MSRPPFERLSQFTPDPGRLDRDALLFAAGRRSVRSGRVWRAAAGVLAVSQALSLVLLWPRPVPPRRPTETLAAALTPSAAVRPDADTSLWSLRSRLPAPDAPRPPLGDLTLIDAGPPLRAFPRSASFHN